MEISEERQGEVCILCPVGRIDNETGTVFQSRLLARLDSDCADLLIDLAAVDYMSSAGLRALMMGAKKAKAKGGRIAVTALAPVVKEIFAIARFSFVVPVFETRSAALSAWS
jgi:anti-sigma B factor antagonist